MGQTLLLASKLWLIVLIPGQPIQYTPMPDAATCRAVEQATRAMYAMVPSNRAGYVATIFTRCAGAE